MSKQRAHWEEIFSRYKASGLSQSTFCKQNNLSINQFRYRWESRNKGLKTQASSLFESVSVMSKPAIPLIPSTINLSIYLPNQIRCDMTTDLNGFSPLLTQLVQLC
jgi:hypothetical protein